MHAKLLLHLRVGTPHFARHKRFAAGRPFKTLGQRSNDTLDDTMGSASSGSTRRRHHCAGWALRGCFSDTKYQPCVRLQRRSAACLASLASTHEHTAFAGRIRPGIAFSPTVDLDEECPLIAEDALPDFDRVARIYRYAEYASLGPILQLARTHFLPQLLYIRKATVVGDGDGRFLARLLAANSNVEALAIDSSEAMLHLLRCNCAAASTGGSRRLQTRRISALDTAPVPGSDLIVSHFFLDCFEQQQVDTLICSYAKTLSVGTLWLLSDFALPHSAWLRPIAAIYIRCLYFAFRVLTGLRVTHLPAPQKALTNAGFTLIARKEWLKGFVYTELWHLG
jgi:hypothetical protein